jgi:hypothetical protein
MGVQSLFKPTRLPERYSCKPVAVPKGAAGVVGAAGGLGHGGPEGHCHGTAMRRRQEEQGWRQSGRTVDRATDGTLGPIEVVSCVVNDSGGSQVLSELFDSIRT